MLNLTDMFLQWHRLLKPVKNGLVARKDATDQHESFSKPSYFQASVLFT